MLKMVSTVATGLSIILILLCFGLDMAMRHFWACATDILWLIVVIAAGIAAHRIHKIFK
jgi:multisubunit Na+/H+ antiporter MnhG subunit